MSSAAHQTIEIERVQRDLNELHEHVIRNWGRITITRGGVQGDAACVLISKAELDELERALEIYNESAGGRAMCDELQQIAERDRPRPTTTTLNFSEGQPVAHRKAHL